MRTLFDNTHRVNGRLGSFWYERLDADSKLAASKLSHLLDAQGLIGKMAGTLTGLSQAGPVALNNLSFRFDLSQIGILGPDLQARIGTQLGQDGTLVTVLRRPTTLISEDSPWLADDLTTWALESENNEYLLMCGTGAPTSFTITGRTLYAVPCPFDTAPAQILAGGVVLLLGIDFWLGQGVIMTSLDPALLFPDGRYVMRGGSTQVQHAFDYTLRVDAVTQPVTAVARFYREDQSPKALEAAVAVAAGLSLFPVDSFITRFTGDADGGIYLLESGEVVRAEYRHTPHAQGEAVTADQVVGGGVKVYYNNGDTQWYRKLDWSAGLDLGLFAPVPGIVLPDAMCQASVFDTDAAGIHARIDLGLGAVQLPFWQHIHTAETASGFLLNSVLHLGYPSDITFVNPIDLWFQYLLGDQAVIVVLDLRLLEAARRRARRFIDDHRILNALTFIREI